MKNTICTTRIILDSFHDAVSTLEQIEPTAFIHCKGRVSIDKQSLIVAASTLSSTILEFCQVNNMDDAYIRALLPESVLFANEENENWFTLVLAGLTLQEAVLVIRESFRAVASIEDWASAADSFTVEIAHGPISMAELIALRDVSTEHELLTARSSSRVVLLPVRNDGIIDFGFGGELACLLGAPAANGWRPGTSLMQ